VEFLITYDISDNARRNKLIRVLNEYGRRVQYSCFEVSVRSSELPRLKRKIAQIIEKEEDSVFIFPISGFSRPLIIKLGAYEPSIGESEVL